MSRIVNSANFEDGKRSTPIYCNEGVNSTRRNVVADGDGVDECRKVGGFESASGKARPFRSSIVASTITSRKKIRPEPKFQRVVTSRVLSLMRKDSRLIAKNPSRFLETIVEGSQSSAAHRTRSHAFSSYLTSFTTQSASETYRHALQNLQEKCRQTKSRTLLLNLGVTGDRLSNSLPTNKSIDVPPSSFEAFVEGGPDQVPSACSGTGYPMCDAEMILQMYLDDIRSACVENLKTWVGESATLKVQDLPFGLPPSELLGIPTKDLEATSATSQQFVRSALEEFFLLDAEYHAKLEELSSRITDNFRELELACWTAQESALLFNLMNMTSEKLCTEVASRLFHGIHTRDNIISQKYRLKVKKALEEKRDSIIKHWLMDKDKLAKKVSAAWQDIERQEKRKEERFREKKSQQKKCKYWIDLLEKMRKESRKRIRAITAMVEPLEEQIKLQQKAKEESERSRRLEQKELVARFQKIRIQNEEEERRNREEIQAKLEMDKKLRIIQNRTRVGLRRQEYIDKKENMKEVERKNQEERKEREAMLEKTKERVDIDYHPWNVLSETHASLVRSHEIQSLISLKEEDETRKFFQERYGFSAETVWKDSRMRLEAKLREAGLIGNSYARQVLLAMQPKTMPHLQSQIKFDL